MTTPSRTGLTFSVSLTYGDGTDGNPTRYVDTHQAAKKPIGSLRYSAALPEDAAKLAYLAVDGIDSENNVNLSDYSNTIVQNAMDFVRREAVIEGASFDSFYRNVLVTNIFSESVVNQKPLYYVHQLAETVNIESVVILDQNKNIVDKKSYKVVAELEYDDDTGLPTGNTDYIALYNDLENSFDQDTGVLEAYFVQYTDSATGTHSVLLANEPVFREATLSDIDFTTMLLKSWVKAYTVEELGSYFHFVLPSGGMFGLRGLESTRLYARKPVVYDNDQPWFPLVSNGAMVQDIDGVSYTYEVPEFRSQLFNPVEPYKLVVSESVSLAGPGLLMLEHRPCAFVDFPVDIVIKNKANDTILYALTTDTTKHGTSYQDGIRWNSQLILSADPASGLVQIDLTLKDYFKYYATYYYTETFYEYVSLDMNPLLNSSIEENDTYVLYMVPRSTALETESESETVYHLRVNRFGKILECSQPAKLISAAPAGVFDPDSIIGLPYGRSGSMNLNTLVDDLPDDDTAWVQTNLQTVGGGGTTPSGELAYTLVEDATTGVHSITHDAPFTSLGLDYTLSFVAKRWDRWWLYIAVNASQYAYISLLTGAVYITGSLVNVEATALTDGWYQIDFRWTAYTDTASDYVQIAGATFNGMSSYPGVNGRISTLLGEVVVTESNNFIENFTIESSPTAAGQDRRYMILAELSALSTATPADVSIIDVRQDGGGVRADSLEEAIQIDPTVAWYADLGGLDGIPYPGRMSVVVKLPWSILKEYGGRFTEDEVREVVQRHMALGTYPLIRYYGVIPDVYLQEDSLDFSNSVRVYWNAEASTTTYNVYYSFSPDTRFSKYNFTPLPENVNGNECLVAGLIGGIPAYIYVTAIVDGQEGPKSRIVKIVPRSTRPSMVQGLCFTVT